MNVKQLKKDFPLLISGNSKTGVAWNIRAIVSCPGRTRFCSTARVLPDGTTAKRARCYAEQGHMGMSQGAYQRNMDTFEVLINTHGAKVAGEYLGALLVHACKDQSVVRLHGSGDIYSVQYGEALYHACLTIRAAGKKPYTYTKSFAVPTLCGIIAKLATVCDVNFSVDKDNLETGIDAYHAIPGIRRLAAMYDNDDTSIVTELKSRMRASQLVFFPAHSGGMKTEPIAGIPNCPALVPAKDRPGHILPNPNRPGSACEQCVGVCHK